MAANLTYAEREAIAVYSGPRIARGNVAWALLAVHHPQPARDDETAIEGQMRGVVDTFLLLAWGYDVQAGTWVPWGPDLQLTQRDLRILLVDLTTIPPATLYQMLDVWQRDLDRAWMAYLRARTHDEWWDVAMLMPPVAGVLEAGQQPHVSQGLYSTETAGGGWPWQQMPAPGTDDYARIQQDFEAVQRVRFISSLQRNWSGPAGGAGAHQHLAACHQGGGFLAIDILSSGGQQERFLCVHAQDRRHADRDILVALARSPPPPAGLTASPTFAAQLGTLDLAQQEEFRTDLVRPVEYSLHRPDGAIARFRTKLP